MKHDHLYHMCDLMEYSGFSRSTLQTYATLGLFPTEQRTESGRREFSADIFDRLDQIKRYLRHRTITEVIQLLESMDKNSKGGDAE